MHPRNWATAAFLLGAVCLQLSAQEAVSGIAVPVTLSGGTIYTHRRQAEDPAESPFDGAFHAMFSPSLRLGPHWFVYSTLHLSSNPFFYYDAFEPGHKVEFQMAQAFLGYTRSHNKTTFVIKAGQLASAFGSFPLRYDDADNPLIDQPLPYATYVKVRPDQLPCTTADFAGGQYEPVSFRCGGSDSDSDGLTPGALYGLPGVEFDVSSGKFDARFQLTNSSPVNPQGLFSDSQHAQWTAGGGYTVVPGLRVGASVFRGPYLDRAVVPWLPAGQNVRDFPATGAGLEAQWARSRWSANGELQWYRFDYPGFRVSPLAAFGYVEIKTIINPRTYFAVRAAYQRNNRIADSGGLSSDTFDPNHQSYEFAIGVRPNRWQLIKVSYEWLQTAEVSGTRDNVFGIQLVTSIRSISAAWR